MTWTNLKKWKKKQVADSLNKLYYFYIHSCKYSFISLTELREYVNCNKVKPLLNSSHKRVFKGADLSAKAQLWILRQIFSHLVKLQISM